MDVDALLYSVCMTAAQQIFDTTVRQEGADDDDVHNDDDNVDGDWDPENDLVVGGGVAGNNDQEIAANIREEEDSVDFNYAVVKGVDNKFNNLCH